MPRNTNFTGIDLIRIARDLRKKPTAAEALLWERVRDHRLGGLKFRRQHVFQGKIADFYCPKAKLIIELDGEVHVTPEQRVRDLHRDTTFTEEGIATLRIHNNKIISDLDGTCNYILSVIGNRLKQLRNHR